MNVLSAYADFDAVEFENSFDRLEVDEWRANDNVAVLQPAILILIRDVLCKNDGFANRFVREESQCLDSRTFLYHEEDLLFQYCMRKHYKIIYTPSLTVCHESGASTDVAASDERSKKIANLKCHMQSMRYVIRETKKYGRYYPKY